MSPATTRQWFARVRYWLPAITLVLSVTSLSRNTHAQSDPFNPGTKLIAPFGAVAFPTGRFGKTDIQAQPPKTGHKYGFSGGFEMGYFVSDFVAVGIGYDYTDFNLDFGDLAKLFPLKTAHTSVPMGQVWTRLLFPNEYSRWKPYLVVGLGLGRPRATTEFAGAVPFKVDSATTIQLVRQESTVHLAVGLTAGIGVLIPFSRYATVMIEPRYRTLSTRGVSRTDRFTTDTGEIIEVKDTDKSYTNWWEIRAGIALLIP